jgi:hypothetical protein
MRVLLVLLVLGLVTVASAQVTQLEFDKAGNQTGKAENFSVFLFKILLKSLQNVNYFVLTGDSIPTLSGPFSMIRFSGKIDPVSFCLLGKLAAL